MIYWLVFFHMTKFRLPSVGEGAEFKFFWQVGQFVFLEVFTFAAP